MLASVCWNKSTRNNIDFDKETSSPSATAHQQSVNRASPNSEVPSVKTWVNCRGSGDDGMVIHPLMEILFFLGLPTTWDDRHQSHKIAIKLDGTGAFDAWVARSRRPKPMCTIVGYSGYGSRPMSLGVWECKKSRSTKNSPRFWFQNWLMVKQCQTPNYGVKNNFNFSAAQWTSDSHVIGATSRFSRSIPLGGAKESDRISCWKTRVARLLTAVGSGSEAIFVAALFPNNKWGAKSY